MAVYNQSVLSPAPLFLQTGSYDARSDRKALADLISPGIVGAGSFAVTFVSGFTLQIAAGVAYVLGQNIADQGLYRQYISAAVTVAIPANAAGNPRLDQIILRIMDNAADASGFNEARIEVVPGTATAGATLANRNGAASLTALGENSKSVLLLADHLTPASGGATSGANIGDKRVTSGVGSGSAPAAGGLPIGSTLEWNSATLPPSSDGTYFVEDGSAISRTTYAIPFARLGTTHGAGDGSTTFNIPDSRSRVPVGYSPSGGHTDHSTVGGNDGVALASRRIRHKHTVSLGYSDPSHSHTIYTYNLGDSSSGFGAANQRNYQAASGTTTIAGGANGSTTGITFSPTVGPQTGSEPTDMIAYINKNKLLRVA